MHQCLERCRGVAVCDALGFHAGLVLVQHQGGDALQGLLGQGLEGDHFVHAAKELRAQELCQRLAGLFLAALGVALVKAKAARALVAAAGVGGHADDRVGEIHRASLRIVDLALVQNLQQNVHHVRVCLFNLVEQHHAVRAAAHLLGELTGFLVAHIARRRADHTGHRVFFHVLAHVQTDERVGAVEQLFCQLLDQLGLAHAGGAHKDEACGTAAAGKVGAAALDGLCHQMHGFVLTDDLLLQSSFQPCQLDELGLPNFHRRDARPQLDDLGHIVHGHLDFAGSGLLGGQLGFQLGDAGLALGYALVVDGFVHIRAFHLGFFLLQGVQLLLHPQILGDDRVRQIAAGAGLVQQVDGLVRQKAVGDVTLAQGDHRRKHLGGHLHMMVLLVVALDAVHHGKGVGYAGLLHPHRLEAALQRLIFFDVLAVLGKGGGTDDLNFAAGKGGL